MSLLDGLARWFFLLTEVHRRLAVMPLQQIKKLKNESRPLYGEEHELQPALSCGNSTTNERDTKRKLPNNQMKYRWQGEQQLYDSLTEELLGQIGVTLV